MYLQRTQIGRHVRRDIEVSDRKKNKVSEELQTPESRNPVLCDLEQAVDAFAHAVHVKVVVA